MIWKLSELELWHDFRQYATCQEFETDIYIQAGGGRMDIYCMVMSQTDLKDLETMHFSTYVEVNYFYYLHMRNPFLKLCPVFL
jgi:hypothetical protein